MNQTRTDMMTFAYNALRFAEFSHEEQELAQSSKPEDSTETIDLSAMFADDTTSSGSFDLRRSRLNPFGKLLQAIPIPTLLVDKSYTIVFANHACKKATGEPTSIEGLPFSVLFPSLTDGEQAEQLIQKVFDHRTPLVAEKMLGSDQIKMLGRIHFRSVRIQKMRMMLVIIEDITPSEPLRPKITTHVI